MKLHRNITPIRYLLHPKISHSIEELNFVSKKHSPQKSSPEAT